MVQRNKISFFTPKPLTGLSASGLVSHRNIPDLKKENPYTFPAGEELDRAVTNALFPGSDPLPFSTDPRLASKLKTRLKALYGHPVVEGTTRLAGRKYFARFESGPSTSTEVLAESMPLAICRLAVLLAANHKERSRT